MNSDLYLPIAVAAASAGVVAFGSWIQAKPPNPYKPRMIPWRAVIFSFGVLGVGALGYLVHILRAQ